MASKQQSLRIAIVLVVAVSAAGTQAAAQSGAGSSSPEMAAYLAEQQARQANDDANMAAASAGLAQGRNAAQRGALEDRFEMVNKAVKNWKAPQGYAATASINASAVEDPFAAADVSPKNAAALQAALGTSGLVWDDVRQVARVAPAGTPPCAGRLKAGDYPMLADGNLLDTPARITLFLASCGDPARPLMVVVESGEIGVRP